MKKALTPGTKIDFVFGGLMRLGLEIDKVDPETQTIEVLQGSNRFYIGPEDIRRVH